MQSNTMIIDTSASINLPMNTSILLGSVQLESIRFHVCTLVVCTKVLASRHPNMGVFTYFTINVVRKVALKGRGFRPNYFGKTD